MFKKLFLSTLLLATTATHAQYFYFWAEDYTATPDVDGSVYVSTHLKSSDDSTYTFKVNEKVIANEVEVFANEVADFPIVVSKKYTAGRDSVTLCSFKKEASVNFKQEVCLLIKLQN